MEYHVESGNYLDEKMPGVSSQIDAMEQKMLPSRKDGNTENLLAGRIDDPA